MVLVFAMAGSFRATEHAVTPAHGQAPNQCEAACPLAVDSAPSLVSGGSRAAA